MSETKTLPAPKEAAFLGASMTVDDVVAHVGLIKEAMVKVMVKDEDYGVIEGTKKPTLYKPGAEKLCVLFRLSPAFETVEQYDGAHLTVKSKCILTHINSGKVMGSGDAICSTKEKKYAKRKLNGKYVDNLELPDSYNTIIKMADKRALVAGVLVVTAASSMFTQDWGDEEKPEQPEKPIVEGKAEVKEPPKEQGITDEMLWVGCIVSAEPKVNGKVKYTHIKGADGVDLLLEQPAESNKAMMDLYGMLCRDLLAAAEKKEELSIMYTISPRGNKLVRSVKAAEPSVLG